MHSSVFKVADQKEHPAFSEAEGLPFILVFSIKN